MFGPHWALRDDLLMRMAALSREVRPNTDDGRKWLRIRQRRKTDRICAD